MRPAPDVFLTRVAGVAANDGAVLLHRSEHDDFWTLPGGRLQIGETLGEALVREMLEEIEVEVVPGPTLWVVENFFEHPPMDGPAGGAAVLHHEIGHYLAMTLPPPFVASRTFEGMERRGKQDAYRLSFEWFTVDVVESLDIRPRVLADLLSSPLPEGRRSVVVTS